MFSCEILLRLYLQRSHWQAQPKEQIQHLAKRNKIIGKNRKKSQ